MDDIAAVVERITVRLEEKKSVIYDEIANYPPPIPACDQQFNRLLEERTKISQALRKWHIIGRNGQNIEASTDEIKQFIAESPYIDDDVWVGKVDDEP